MTLAPTNTISVQVTLPPDITVYEGSPELAMLVVNLDTLVPFLMKMMMETMTTTGELRVPFKDGRVVDGGPGKMRPKIMLD